MAFSSSLAVESLSIYMSEIHSIFIEVNEEAVKVRFFMNELGELLSLPCSKLSFTSENGIRHWTSLFELFSFVNEHVKDVSFEGGAIVDVPVLLACFPNIERLSMWIGPASLRGDGLEKIPHIKAICNLSFYLGHLQNVEFETLDIELCRTKTTIDPKTIVPKAKNYRIVYWGGVIKSEGGFGSLESLSI
jgi:hypothetical protein